MSNQADKPTTIWIPELKPDLSIIEDAGGSTLIHLSMQLTGKIREFEIDTVIKVREKS